MARLLLLSALLLLSLPGSAPAQQAATPVFETDIVPLVKKHCWKCHSARTRKGELNLQTLEGMLVGGESGEAAIVPGNPEASPLMALVDKGDMPPGKVSLNEADRDLLGLDNKQLVYDRNGLEERLTGVSEPRVVSEIIA